MLLFASINNVCHSSTSHSSPTLMDVIADLFGFETYVLQISSSLFSVVDSIRLSSPTVYLREMSFWLTVSHLFADKSKTHRVLMTNRLFTFFFLSTIVVAIDMAPPLIANTNGLSKDEMQIEQIDQDDVSFVGSSTGNGRSNDEYLCRTDDGRSRSSRDAIADRGYTEYCFSSNSDQWKTSFRN